VHRAVDRGLVERQHVLVCDNGDGSERTPQGIRAGDDPERREEGAVDVGDAGSPNRGVDPCPLCVEPPKASLVAGQRAIGPPNPLPRGPDVHGDFLDECECGQPRARGLGEDGAATERDDARRAGESLGHHLLLEQAKLRLAVLEELGDGPVAALDLGIRVDEGSAGALGRDSPDRRLAGSHEADEREVLL
jgi:hypothetical protein